MNSDLLDIITTGRGADSRAGIPSGGASSLPGLDGGDSAGGVDDGGGVDDILAPRPRSLQDNKPHGGGGTAADWMGLSIGRSQSAAPETWQYDRFPLSTRSAALGRDGGNRFSFRGGRSGFFDEEEEDRETSSGHVAGARMRRPASTGVIGRPSANGGNDGDVNSILETLGLMSLEHSDEQQSSNIPPYSPGKSLGGIDSHGSLVMGAHSPSKKSIMEKIHEGDPTNTVSNYFASEEGSASNATSNVFSSNHASQEDLQRNVSAPSTMAAQQYPVEERPPLSNQISSHGISAQFPVNQYAQRPQQTSSLRQVYQTDLSHYEPQQQVCYHHQQQGLSQNNYQDYRAQQTTSLNIMHAAVPQFGAGQQQTIYQINASATAPPYGFEYHAGAPQQHISVHSLPAANHILLGPHQQVQQVAGAPMHGQPQYISIVPIQAAGPHVIGGAPGHNTHAAYAYVQYGGDGGVAANVQPALVAGGGAAAAFVMGPNGPIAVSAGAPGVGGVLPVGSTVVYGGGGHGSSPPGGQGRSPPTRGGGGTPSKSLRKRGVALASPRGKSRADKGSASLSGTPSKLGPEAAGLLIEIRAAKSRSQWTIHDIKGHVVEFCLDQNGSRFIQQRLEVADSVEKGAVMEEIIPAIRELQNDVFGNYVVQKLYEFGTDKMKKDLKGTLEGNMLLLSLQMYGCRVVQKALESLGYDDLCDLLREFESHVLTCIQDQNGNHVMQKVVEVMSARAREAEVRTGEAGLADAMSGRIQFVADDVLANARALCCHPYGCRVLQRMLEHCAERQRIATLDGIRLCHGALLDDQYGNYVIQHVLRYGRESDRDSLLRIIVQNDLLKLSRQKFASNVVEKLLKYGNSGQRNAIVREMLKVVDEGGTSQEGAGSSVLLLMVRDAYANYVVQTAIDVVPEGSEKRMLLDELKTNEVQLRNYTFAKHIVAKLGTK